MNNTKKTCSCCGRLMTFEECAQEIGLWCTECLMVFGKKYKKITLKSYLKKSNGCCSSEPNKIIYADGCAILQNGILTKLKLNSKFKRRVNLKIVAKRKKERKKAREEYQNRNKNLDDDCICMGSCRCERGA